MSIEIANESDADVDETSIISAARFALDHMEVHPRAELSVQLVRRDVMEGLHERWMGLPGATDVLAFPMDEQTAPRHSAVEDDFPALLGDIVLCPNFADQQAHDAGHALLDELHMLTVHGVLHLLGYDHAEPDEEREMFALQADILTGFRAASAAATRREARRTNDDRSLGAAGLNEPAEDGERRDSEAP